MGTDSQCDQTLARLRDLLKGGKPADVAGKTYPVGDLNDMADKMIQARKDADAQASGFKAAREPDHPSVGRLSAGTNFI